MKLYMHGGIDWYENSFPVMGFNSQESGDKGTNWVKMNRV